MAYQSYTILTRKTPLYYWYKCPQCGKTVACSKIIETKTSYDNLHAGFGKAAERRLSERQDNAEMRVNEEHQKKLSDIFEMAKTRDYKLLEAPGVCPVCKYRLPWRQQPLGFLNVLKTLSTAAAVIFGILAAALLIDGALSRPEGTKMILIRLCITVIFALIAFALPKYKEKLQEKTAAECSQLDEDNLPHMFLSKEDFDNDIKTMAKQIPER